mmetsp:Transcript_44468/g.106847  ORF Transcript_44468/g.106847 Transcript_44468/m.106847 type:complete len:215 (-) Transcript_44468:253-897(-)|eukprot:scaffold4640_cov63-Phaeocystis_antarctica.AAC.3
MAHSSVRRPMRRSTASSSTARPTVGAPSRSRMYASGGRVAFMSLRSHWACLRKSPCASACAMAKRSRRSQEARHACERPSARLSAAATTKSQSCSLRKATLSNSSTYDTSSAAAVSAASSSLSRTYACTRSCLALASARRGAISISELGHALSTSRSSRSTSPVSLRRPSVTLPRAEMSSLAMNSHAIASQDCRCAVSTLSLLRVLLSGPCFSQ